MHFTQLLNEASLEEATALAFEPANFVENLQHMGVGMLTIFVVIGVIALTTVLINKIFND